MPGPYIQGVILPQTSRTPPDLDLDAGLKRLGFDRFRPGQREAIETLLAEGHLLLVAPTGGGKSRGRLPKYPFAAIAEVDVCAKVS